MIINYMNQHFDIKVWLRSSFLNISTSEVMHLQYLANKNLQKSLLLHSVTAIKKMRLKMVRFLNHNQQKWEIDGNKPSAFTIKLIVRKNKTSLNFF